jgi:lysine 2,3-aminomutase
MEHLRGHTTGYGVPTYVIDAPGGGGKVPVSPEYVLSRNRDRVVLRNYEGKIFEYIEGDTNAPAYKVSENFETPHTAPREQGRGRF